jgi:SAM-dependent methyltransferase
MDADGPGLYRYLDFNAPLSGARADAIAMRLAAAGPVTVLDIGCGWGELLLRVLARTPDARGVGVDIDERLLTRGRAAAETRGLDDRVSFVTGTPGLATVPADLVICVGSSHAFGEDAGLGHALRSLYDLVRPGGRLLLGEATWDPRAPADKSLVWDDMVELPDLAGLVDLACAAGFRPLYIEEANPDELDALESGFLADSEEWLLARSDHPDAAQVRAHADEHRNRWLRGYRRAFGFAYLTLGRRA